MKKLEVLIVEDNLKVAKAHQLYVEKVDGYKVTGVVNLLVDAEEMVKALEPDLLLLDIYFPDGNGMIFLETLRSKNFDLDVILITAATEVQLLHNALRGGVFDYMIKPVFFSRFEEALGKYRQHWENLHSIEGMSQEAVDRVFHHQTPFDAHQTDMDVPKGIDPLTLGKVVKSFDDFSGNGLTAEEVGNILGASRTTGRKYLEYLISTGFLRIDLEYGTIGRPERRYRKA